MTIRSARKSKKIATKRKKGFSWRRSKAARKVKRKIRLLFFAASSLVLTVFLLTSFSLYKFAKAPLISANSGAFDKNKEWMGKEDINILFLVVDKVAVSPARLKSAYILRLDPQNQGYFLVKLPIFADIELAQRYGEGDLAHAFFTGSVKLSQESVFKQTALYLDSYVLVDESGILEVGKMFGEVNLRDIRKSVTALKLYTNPSVVKFLRNFVRTNLSVAEIFRVLGFVRGADTESVKIFELDNESFMDKELFDGFWKNYILAGFVNEENFRVLVLNGAEISGLAGWGGRVVENSGITLLDVGNTEKKYDESFLAADDPFSKTVQKLSGMFGIPTVKDRAVVKDEDTMFLRGDVVVILGLDIGNIL
ncbi:hypothetical protein COV27_00735 [candidate division WWE3 bacterium CG10_big_fil_rev_8_21_14_0_10_39_14]|nr:MAG: hypothetical protein COV27_00735 [candidate division WWE3 bacterium CG10_big_fil_rev_8_21_14_0_10_39_14]